MENTFVNAYVWVLQWDGRSLELFEQAHTITKEEWYKIDVDLVQ